MSSKINKKSQYTIDSHNNVFHWIGKYKQKSHLVRNKVIMVVF